MSYEDKVKEALKNCFKHMRLKGAANEKVVLMYSGGMDSVSLLWNLLEHTEQEVYVHAIHLHNREGRHKAEAHAILKSIEYIKENQRHFNFSSSVYSWVADYCGGRDMTLALFQALRVGAGLGKSFAAVYTGDYNMSKEEAAEAYGVLNAMTTAKFCRPVWATPFDYLTRTPVERSKSIYLSMPEPLREMYWSCRKPTEVADGFITCGECHACKRQAQMKESLNA
jgi:7-cyano-7-deazaguanine synthase in queuosine biosynthesis